MDRPSVPITESDFVLFDAINHARHRPEIVRRFRSGVQTCLAQNISRGRSIARIREFQQARIISRAALAETTTPDTCAATTLDSSLDREEVSASFRKTRLRVSHNFMLRPRQSGFEIWSPVSRAHHVLSLEQTLILTFFSSGNRVDRLVAESKSHANNSTALHIARWLHRNGLLVAIPPIQDSRLREPKSKPQAKPGRPPAPHHVNRLT